MIPRNTTDMREKHGHAKIVNYQKVVGSVTEKLHPSFLLVKLIFNTLQNLAIMFETF